MIRLRLAMAVDEYEHVRDLACGKVRAGGIDLNVIEMSAAEACRRFAEFDVCEMAMGRHIASLASGEDRWVAVPVFPSRLFGLGSILVRSDGPARRPEDLAGKRVGIRGWSETSAIYVKGWMCEHVKIPLEGIEWFQAVERGEEQGQGQGQGQSEVQVQVQVPRGIRLVRVPGKPLEQLLLAGEIDALVGASDSLLRDERVRRLIPDHRAAEARYCKDTGIFPILTTIVIGKHKFDANRWAALELYRAFLKAKDNALERLLSQGIAKFPMPWGSTYAEEAKQRFGRDYWPYGVAANRTTLEAFCRFCHEQGLCVRRLKPEELFASEASGA